MLQIYYINDPTYLSENLYPELLKNGEVKWRDFRAVFNRLGIVSYTDHYANLALRLRLMDVGVGEDYYFLSEHTVDEIRQDDPGERLFDVLTRLPHFARWVQLSRDEGRENVDYKNVVPLGARQYKMRKQRSGQFDSWAKKITELANDTTFGTLQSEYERRSAYIWEDYLSFEDIPTELDPVVLLVLLGAAANESASCKITRLLEPLPCDRNEFGKIVDEVFGPVGVPLYNSGTCIGLRLPTELRVDNRGGIWRKVSEVLGDNVDINSLQELTDHLQFKTNILDFVDTPQGPTPEFTVIDGTDDPSIESRRVTEEPTTRFDSVQHSESARFVAIPPTIVDFPQQKLFEEIERPIRKVAEECDRSGEDLQFEYHIREQLYHTGSIPLLKAPNFESLTLVGEQYFRENTKFRRRLTFDHLLYRNLPVRATVAASDLDQLKVEHAGEAWMIRTDHGEIGVFDILLELLDRDGLSLIGIEADDPVHQIISYLRTAGILKAQGTVEQLQITPSIHEHLKENPRGGRQVFEESKRRVQRVVDELQ